MIRRAAIQLVSILGLLGWAPVAAEDTFAGRWRTTFGEMRLKQVGDKVSGSYATPVGPAEIEGRVKERRFDFTYREPGDVSGEGMFLLAQDGKTFAGRWREKGNTTWSAWLGERAPPLNYGGLWASSFGRMRFVQDGDKVEGIYAYTSTSSISGKVEDGKFKFRYNEPKKKKSGEGWFELVDGGNSLRGKWKEDGQSRGGDWVAKRVQPQPGIRWLVVIEARWEANLAQREYAFGDMLKAFFDRNPNVQVRRRSFNDEEDLRRWCREVSFLAEPVVLCIATHGSRDGIHVEGRIIPPEVIARGLRYASNVKLMHFSACLISKEKMNACMKLISPENRFPISGYSTSVDWAASAVMEFMYFDLVLSRRMPPARAAEQIVILFPTAGSRPVPKAVLRPAGFQFLPPNREAKPSVKATAEKED